MFEWKEEYRVDGGLIDSEHKHLLELIDKTVALVKSTADTDATNRAIQEVYGYMKQHFQNEEMAMMVAEFPGYENHVEEHRKIVQQMESMLVKCKDIQALSEEIPCILGVWAIGHMIDEDKKFALYLESRANVAVASK